VWRLACTPSTRYFSGGQRRGADASAGARRPFGRHSFRFERTPASNIVSWPIVRPWAVDANPAGAPKHVEPHRQAHVRRPGDSSRRGRTRLVHRRQFRRARIPRISGCNRTSSARLDATFWICRLASVVLHSFELPRASCCDEAAGAVRWHTRVAYCESIHLGDLAGSSEITTLAITFTVAP
jgi:hypothetical protein